VDMATAALAECDLCDFKEAVQHFNSCQRRHAAETGSKADTNACTVFAQTSSPTQVAHILGQVYTIVVDDPKALTHYKAFSSEVYGEANAGLINEIIQTTPIKDGDVFLDMGSGVGQVALQVAAQCAVKDSIGIELRDVPAMYQDRMGHEFKARMRLYNKSHSPFNLKKGSFLSHEDLPDEVLRTVDVIFVNNVAFESSLNRALLERFMAMKKGAKVVSLVSFGKRKIKNHERRHEKVKKCDKGSWYFSCDGCGRKGENFDDGQRMVECFHCGVWQHTKCNGIMQTRRISKSWMCQKCSWAGQKQARDSQQDFFTVDGPYVCDLAGAVSWTSSVINYYIHTIIDPLNPGGGYNPVHAAAESAPPEPLHLDKKTGKAKVARKPKHDDDGGPRKKSRLESLILEDDDMEQSVASHDNGCEESGAANDISSQCNLGNAQQNIVCVSTIEGGERSAVLDKSSKCQDLHQNMGNSNPENRRIQESDTCGSSNSLRMPEGSGIITHTCLNITNAENDAVQSGSTEENAKRKTDLGAPCALALCDDRERKDDPADSSKKSKMKLDNLSAEQAVRHISSSFTVQSVECKNLQCSKSTDLPPQAQQSSQQVCREEPSGQTILQSASVHAVPEQHTKNVRKMNMNNVPGEFATASHWNGHMQVSEKQVLEWSLKVSEPET